MGYANTRAMPKKTVNSKPQFGLFFGIDDKRGAKFVGRKGLR
jgi:hypothetical protein